MNHDKFVQWLRQISQLMGNIQHELYTLRGHGSQIESFLNAHDIDHEWFILYDDALRASLREVSTALSTLNSVLLRLSSLENDAA